MQASNGMFGGDIQRPTSAFTNMRQRQNIPTAAERATVFVLVLVLGSHPPLLKGVRSVVAASGVSVVCMLPAQLPLCYILRHRKKLFVTNELLYCSWNGRIEESFVAIKRMENGDEEPLVLIPFLTKATVNPRRLIYISRGK